MTRKELAARISEEAGLPRKQAELTVHIFCSAIMDALTAGEEVRLKGFGTFEVRNYSQRAGRNPKTGEISMIPPSRRVLFKAGKTMKEQLSTN